MDTYILIAILKRKLEKIKIYKHNCMHTYRHMHNEIERKTIAQRMAQLTEKYSLNTNGELPTSN